MSVSAIINNFADLMRDAVPWFLVGAVLGVVAQVLVKPAWMLRWIQSERASVFHATVAGALLPGSSLTTVPLAVSLKSQGARLGTLTAFILISPLLSPETIVLTAAMLGGKMTVGRIVIPILMSLAMGLVLNALEKRTNSIFRLPKAAGALKQDGCCASETAEERPRFWPSFGKLLHPLWIYLLVGLLAVAVLQEWVTPADVAQYMHGGVLAYVIAAAVGIPLYVCEGAEVPLTFSLLKMGVGSGPAFTFLLASVGTCIPTIALAPRVIGWAATGVYVAAWLLLALGGGWLMNFWFNMKTRIPLLTSMLSLALMATSVRADVCVWRDPERTMQKIFPQARDYKTRTEKMTPERMAAIEKAIGVPLEVTERKEFDLYEITGQVDGKVQTIGTILALAGKGEYGTIEVVIGVNTDRKVAGVYIQRSRERVTRALQSPEFLQQFAGKTKEDGFNVGKDIKPASPDAAAASRVAAFVVKKMLVFHDVLTSGENKP